MCIHNTVKLASIILSIIGGFYLVSSPDLIRHTYIALSITRTILKVIHAGVGFGSGTETRFYQYSWHSTIGQRLSNAFLGTRLAVFYNG